MNVTAIYRTGLGLEGLMKAGQLSIPLERPVGLRSVSNPLPADGAADPETRDRAREAAPNSVKTFGRAVSLADFEAIATASGLAARASVTWVWSELERAVHVTVAGAGRQQALHSLVGAVAQRARHGARSESAADARQLRPRADRHLGAAAARSGLRGGCHAR